MDLSLNPKSSRAFRSRYKRTLERGAVLKANILIGWATLIFGVLLIIFGYNVGYFLLTLTAIIFIVVVWYKGSLEDIKPSGNNIDGQLDYRILAGLKTEQPSAKEIWQALASTPARYFFQNRYLLDPVIFESQLGEDASSGQAIWQVAEGLMQKFRTNGLTNSVVFVALLKSVPNIESILNSVAVDLQDVENGISWFENLQTKAKLARQKKYFGGFARDWAFGYTPILQRLGHNISSDIQRNGFFIDTQRKQSIVDQMVQSMSANHASITIVGDTGVGKTTCVYAFANRLIEDDSLPQQIRYNQVIALDAPSLLAQAGNPGQLEQIVIQVLNEASKAKNIILFFDDAQVFFGTGPNSVNLVNVLTPVLEASSVRMVLAMTPKEWQALGANNSLIASHLQPIRLESADETDTITVLQDQVVFSEYSNKVIFTYQSLREAYKLGGRYIDSQAMPGAALAVLKSAAPLAKNGLVTADIVKQSIELSAGVKLQQATGSESQSLLHLEDDLHKHVINQKRAVSVIADALRRSRSGVGNPNRPVGTFLFLGPTGVGKTELSKALARVYFNNPDALVRVDMNQYIQPEDAQRLITPMVGDQLGFLGQIKRSPFSVVLLDEIEKAHPSVVNLLLQMLDEGEIEDSENKKVSFKDAIVIATSNAGADEIRRIIDSGEDLANKESQFVEGLIDQNIFAPEFINRFDEVVLFRPLNQDELLQVVDLIIATLNLNLDNQKISVVLSEPAKRWLVQKGYDSKLGARPMRRVIQRYVENIIAKKLLEQSTRSGEAINLDVADFEQQDIDA